MVEMIHSPTVASLYETYKPSLDSTAKVKNEVLNFNCKAFHENVHNEEQVAQILADKPVGSYFFWKDEKKGGIICSSKAPSNEIHHAIVEIFPGGIYSFGNGRGRCDKTMEGALIASLGLHRNDISAVEAF